MNPCLLSGRTPKALIKHACRHVGKQNNHYLLITLGSGTQSSDIYKQACVPQHPGSQYNCCGHEGLMGRIIARPDANMQHITLPHRQAGNTCSSRTHSHTQHETQHAACGALYEHPHAPGGLAGSAHCGTPMGSGGGIPGMPCAATHRFSWRSTDCHTTRTGCNTPVPLRGASRMAIADAATQKRGS